MGITRNEKIRLNSIKTVTFHQDALTKSRRNEPIAQLTCKGKACELFQPEVVQCTSMGDDGSGDMQWKCDTDLPSSLRLGEVHVGCEGWSRPGDKFVVKGSCGLEYNLIQVDRRLDEGSLYDFSRGQNLDWPALLFSLAFFGMAFAIIYSIVRSCLQRHAPRYAPRPLGNFWPGGGGGGHDGGPGGPGGGGPGFNGGVPPPPYTKDPARPVDPTAASASSSSSSTNFLTGAALGGAAAYLLSGGGGRDRHTETEWDRFRTGAPLDWQTDDGPRRRGESSRMAAARADSGTGGLGDMRRATGFGGSSVR